MNRISSRSAAAVAVTAIALTALILLALPARAASHEEGSVTDQIKALILADNQHVREKLKDREGGIAKDGALQFWSSGGLIQWVPADAKPSEYDSFSITPKHIKVIELPGGQAAVAMYYSEGSFQPKGGAPVNHYMTRVMEVYVKEDGKWVNRAAHWSPIAAGSGTSQTSVD